MSVEMNPDILAAGNTGAAVPSLNAITKPLPVVEVDTSKYYHCSIAHASFHLADGKRLAFVGGMYVTKLESDQAYLDGEIKCGNSYLREATEREIESFEMQRNPEATFKKKALNDPEVKKALMEEMLNDPSSLDELRQRILAEAGIKPNNAGIVASNKLADIVKK